MTKSTMLLVLPVLSVTAGISGCNGCDCSYLDGSWDVTTAGDNGTSGTFVITIADGVLESVSLSGTTDDILLDGVWHDDPTTSSGRYTGIGSISCVGDNVSYALDVDQIHTLWALEFEEEFTLSGQTVYVELHGDAELTRENDDLLVGAGTWRVVSEGTTVEMTGSVTMRRR